MSQAALELILPLPLTWSFFRPVYDTALRLLLNSVGFSCSGSGRLSVLKILVCPLISIHCFIFVIWLSEFQQCLIGTSVYQSHHHFIDEETETQKEEGIYSRSPSEWEAELEQTQLRKQALVWFIRHAAPCFPGNHHWGRRQALKDMPRVSWLSPRGNVAMGDLYLLYSFYL